MGIVRLLPATLADGAPPRPSDDGPLLATLSEKMTGQMAYFAYARFRLSLIEGPIEAG